MAVNREDIATVGRAMCAEIREEMEANHCGKMVVIDVNSGDYEIGCLGRRRCGYRGTTVAQAWTDYKKRAPLKPEGRSFISTR